MWSDEFFADHLDRVPVVAILRGFDPQRTIELCHAVWDGGVRLVEVPIQTEAARPSFEAAVAEGGRFGRPVGAGTVLTLEQVQYVYDVGGAFTVSPGADRKVTEAAAELRLPHLPGVATASDIIRVLGWGLAWMKMFPASQMGVDWVQAQLRPFPGAAFVATGGVDANNYADFLRAGCRGVGVGGAVQDPVFRSEIAARQWENRSR